MLNFFLFFFLPWSHDIITCSGHFPKDTIFGFRGLGLIKLQISLIMTAGRVFRPPESPSYKGRGRECNHVITFGITLSHLLSLGEVYNLKFPIRSIWLTLDLTWWYSPIAWPNISWFWRCVVTEMVCWRSWCTVELYVGPQSYPPLPWIVCACFSWLNFPRHFWLPPASIEASIVTSFLRVSLRDTSLPDAEK